MVGLVVGEGVTGVALALELSSASHGSGVAIGGGVVYFGILGGVVWLALGGFQLRFKFVDLMLKIGNGLTVFATVTASA